MKLNKKQKDLLKKLVDNHVEKRKLKQDEFIDGLELEGKEELVETDINRIAEKLFMKPVELKGLLNVR